jgi:hypothetical protein
LNPLPATIDPETTMENHIISEAQYETWTP